MTVDIDKAINTAVRTGKVLIGCKQTINAARTGKAKILILASNCPEKIREDIQHYARLSKVLLYAYPGSGLDLGETCGKPFGVSAVAIKKPGDSDILKLVEASNVE